MASQPDRRAYRIVSNEYPPFDGTGTYQWGSRWVSPGRYVIHAAETYSLAILENLVHWQTNSLPQGLVCVKVEIPDTISQKTISLNEFPDGLDEAYNNTRVVGDQWYDSGESCICWVPSVVSPHENNVLVNQRHTDFKHLVIHEPEVAEIDRRLTPE